jgi:hypothetical protein
MGQKKALPGSPSVPRGPLLEFVLPCIAGPAVLSNGGCPEVSVGYLGLFAEA